MVTTCAVLSFVFLRRVLIWWLDKIDIIIYNIYNKHNKKLKYLLMVQATLTLVINWTENLF